MLTHLTWPFIALISFWVFYLQVLHSTKANRNENLSASQPKASVEYILERIEKPSLALKVTLTVTGTPEGRTLFQIFDTWGGAADVPDEVHELQACGAVKQELEVEQTSSHQWTVVHEPGERLHLTYLLHAAADGNRGRHRYLPVITDDLILIIGHTAIVHPEHLLDKEKVSVEIRWKNFETPDWQIITSFGPSQKVLHLSRSIDELAHAFYVAGKLRLYTREIKGAPLHFSVAGDDWRFSDNAFVDMVLRIVAFERSFFEDSVHPPYTVCLVPYPYKEPDSSSKGGSSLTDSFILYLTPHGYVSQDSTGLEPLETLITHEYFHNWNVPEPDDEAMHWFSEGFTVFYEGRILYRLGLYSLEEYIGHLNRSVRDYMTSPFKESPNEDYVRSRMLNPELASLPYVRGAVIALLVDHEIRRASQGTRCLDDLMREKTITAQVTGELLGNEAIFGLIEKYTDSRFARTIRAIAMDGAPAVLAPDIYGKCLKMQTKDFGPFELGFNFEESMKHGIVKGVKEGSNAFSAGLRNGQKLVGWSVTPGDADTPVRLSIAEKGSKKVITYKPQSAPVAVPQFSLREGHEIECREIL